ncbi:MAG: ethanolamine utilization protein, partial [Fusobacterium sp.]|nr:ethanolamine utilization protein [Fusobacterium sp.]
EESKEEISFLGFDIDFKEKLSKIFLINEEAGTLVVSELSIKNLFNISKGIYENEYEEKIIKQILKGNKVVLLEEGIEYLNYKNIPDKLLEKYENYLNSVKEYGIKIYKKSYFLEKKNCQEEIYNEKLLDFKKIKNLNLGINNRITISENTIVTSSAQDYAKEKNIIIVKRR